jgi:16S rRNA pseudouridine516 synthase
MKSRVDKLLAGAGFGSRRDIKRVLRERTFCVNGVPCRDPSFHVDPEHDQFELDGENWAFRARIYLMLNKPAGVVTSTADPVHRSVLDLLEEPWRGSDVFPVGRLDIDTRGLLLLTNDGALAHRLTSPKTGVEKKYLADLELPVDDDLFAEYARRFSEGVSFHNGHNCLPAKLERASKRLALTIEEGKYHQVKKMFRVVGNRVIGLERVSMGPLVLDPGLPPGAVRELTADEITGLREAVGLVDPE